MKILVDENIPNVTVLELRALGHDVLDIRGTARQGMFDDELWPLAQTEQRTLVTTDKGFAEHRDEQHCGTWSYACDNPTSRGFMRESWLLSGSLPTGACSGRAYCGSRESVIPECWWIFSVRAGSQNRNNDVAGNTDGIGTISRGSVGLYCPAP